MAVVQQNNSRIIKNFIFIYLINYLCIYVLICFYLFVSVFLPDPLKSGMKEVEIYLKSFPVNAEVRLVPKTNS